METKQQEQNKIKEAEQQPGPSDSKRTKTNPIPDIPGMLPYVRRKKKAKVKVKVETAEERSKARYARLTDLRKEKSASKSRSKNKLETKVFNASSVRKVSASLDSQIKRRHLDKFGDDFNT